MVRLSRICNYFNNIDNSLDNAQVRFVHNRHREAARDQIVKGDPVISVEESEWGIKRYVKFPDGKDITAYFGMPNINYLNGQVVDAEISGRTFSSSKCPWTMKTTSISKFGPYLSRVLTLLNGSHGGGKSERRKLSIARIWCEKFSRAGSI